MGFWTHRNTKFESPEKGCVLAIFREKKRISFTYLYVLHLDENKDLVSNFMIVILGAHAFAYEGRDGSIVRDEARLIVFLMR